MTVVPGSFDLRDGAYMTPHQLRSTQPARRPIDHRAALIESRRRMIATGQWSNSQFMGRRWPIGCVALEITQRCNLDCTVCYLSENSEAVKDLPLEEVFRRIDMIFDHYITHNKCHAKYNDLCNAISNFLRDEVPRNWYAYAIPSPITSE
ncbi:MAG: hypothetical protein ABI407_14565 [Bradyrhizobium sp.]